MQVELPGIILLMKKVTYRTRPATSFKYQVLIFAAYCSVLQYYKDERHWPNKQGHHERTGEPGWNCEISAEKDRIICISTQHSVPVFPVQRSDVSRIGILNSACRVRCPWWMSAEVLGRDFVFTTYLQLVAVQPYYSSTKMECFWGRRHGY